MTDGSPTEERSEERAGAESPSRRRVVLPMATEKRRGGLLLIGLALVVFSVLGFWLVLQSVDARTGYLMAARNIERWETVGPGDFAVVNANVGAASAAAPGQIQDIAGRWATGRIPAGTIVTAGMFETPPLSGAEESGKVMIELTLPAEDAPFDELRAGDTIALLGQDPTAAGFGGDLVEAQGQPLTLIGVLTLEFVTDSKIYYVVTPQQAMALKQTVDRYTASANRLIVKLGQDVTADEIAAAMEAVFGSVDPASGQTLPSDFE